MVAPPGNQVENGENKPQPVASGETGLLDNKFTSMHIINPLFLSSWSIIDLLSADEFSLDQFAEFAQNSGFHGVEFIDRHFPDFTREFQASLIKSIKKTGIQATLGLTTDFTIENTEALQSQIEYILNMLEFAAKLDSKAVRVLLGGADSLIQKWLKKIVRSNTNAFTLDSIKKQKFLTSKLQGKKIFQLAHKILIKNKKPKPLKNIAVKEKIIKSFERILPIAEKYNLNLAIENHWGVSAYTDNILQIIDHFRSQNLGTCPDFGNFTVHQNRYSELEKLLPYAKEVHAKSYQFNTNGEEISVDYQKCISIVKSTGFKGPLVVEYEGGGDKLKNSLRTQELVLKYL
jgi:sugar phosphate isomerase/epimerase